MAVYKAPLQDIEFILNDVFQAPSLWETLPEVSEVTGELASTILEEGAKICENELFAVNRTGDEEGCSLENGQVKTPKGFREAYQTLTEAGWGSLGGNPEFGGQGMPKMLTLMFEEMMFAANTSLALYPSLTAGATLAINAHASDALKALYLPPMYEGRWAGSMCLTEPHAGTDLGIIRTRAVPQEDGSYSVTGTKIFITGGEHDLTENIIHLVLAKLPDAPEGPKGISLFLVPKINVSEQGDLEDANAVSCGSIEHKMGIKGSSTCVMNFDGARGYLVGEVNKGLAAMFTMMNYERLTIGLQGIGLAEVSYQSALEYARERIQSRSPDGPKSPEKQADPILVHPDVRRMLLTQKAYTQGCRAFAAYIGMKLDLAKFSDDDTTRKQADAMVALLTPIAKAYFTDRGFDACVLGQQVFGGHGYIREWGMEQMVRDARIAQIYEGTNGIQALDLTGRKVIANQGEWVGLFCTELEETAARLKSEEKLTLFASSLADSTTLLRKATDTLLSQAGSDPFTAGSASTDYLNLFGLVAMNYMWALMAEAALPRADESFCRAKIRTGEFFVHKLLPEASAYLAKIEAGSSPMMILEDADF